MINPVYFSIILASIASVSLVTSIIYCFYQKLDKENKALIAVLFASLIWSFGYLVELIVEDIDLKLLWSKFQYFGIVSISFALFIMVIRFLKLEIKLPIFYALAIIPGITLILIWTNDSHNLIWSNTAVGKIGDYTIILYQHGIMYWVLFAYSYLTLLAGNILLLRGLIYSPPLLRKQIFIILISCTVPWAGNLLYITNNFFSMDLTPIGFSITGVLSTIGLHYYRLFTITPIAFKMIFDSINDGIIIIDSDKNVYNINNAGENLIGNSFNDVVGINIYKCIPLQLQRYVHVTDIPNLSENVLLKRIEDGDRYYSIMTIPIFSNYKKSMVGWAILFNDITDLRESENRLQQSNKELKEKNKELDSFARTVAHDLRNPLSTIIGTARHLSTASDELSLTQSNELMNNILKTSENMDSTISEILILSEIREKHSVNLVPLKMGKIIGDAIDGLYELIEKNKVTIAIPGKNGWVGSVGYAPWVKLVWVNLLTNAIKYGGNPSIIKVGSKQLSDGFVQYWIQDNGDGLSDEEKEKIFKPFERLSRKNIHGTGLGLSIVRRMIRKQGGEVGVDNLESRGNRFYFTLPING